MERSPSPEVVQSRTRKKHYTRGSIMQNRKPASVVTKTSTPDEQGSRTKTFLQSWLHSCNDSAELCKVKIPAILHPEQEHKNVTGRSRRTSQRVKDKTSTQNNKVDKSLQSNTENEFLEPVCIESDLSPEEDLFGFEKLLKETEKPNRTKFNINEKPSLNHKSANVLSSTVLAEKQPLQKRLTPWTGLLDSPEQKTKSTHNTNKTRRKKGKPNEIKQEVLLFGETTASPTVEHKCTIFSSRDIKFEDSDSDHSCSDAGHRKVETKKVVNKKNPPKPIVPDIPWKEIMEHELVIE